MKGYVAHLRSTMGTMGSHIERINKIYQIRYRQSQEELRMASQMMISMGSVALEPYNPSAFPIKFGQQDAGGVVKSLADNATVPDGGMHPHPAIEPEVPVAPAGAAPAVAQAPAVEKAATMFLDMRQSLSRQARSMKRLDSALAAMRTQMQVDLGEGSTPQCQSAYDEVYKIWTNGHKDYMKAYIEFETERKVHGSASLAKIE